MSFTSSTIKKLILLPLLSALLVFAPAPPQAHAKSYKIAKTEISATLGQDGQMQVQEKRTYDFNGSFSFAYLQINTHPDPSKEPGRSASYKLSNFQLCDEQICYDQLEPAQGENLKTPNSFYVDPKSDRHFIKWFCRANNQQKDFTLSYTIENAITRHTDTDELYWQFIGADWDESHHQVFVQLDLDFIKLDDAQFGDQLQAWLHGQTGGTVSISNPNTITFQIDKLNSGNFFEGRVLFPHGTFANAATGILSRERIQEQEQRFIRQTQRKELWNIGLVMLQAVSNLGIVSFIILEVIKRLKYGRGERHGVWHRSNRPIVV